MRACTLCADAGGRSRTGRGFGCRSAWSGRQVTGWPVLYLGSMTATIPPGLLHKVPRTRLGIPLSGSSLTRTRFPPPPANHRATYSRRLGLPDAVPRIDRRFGRAGQPHTGGAAFAAVMQRRDPAVALISARAKGVRVATRALAPWAERFNKEHGAISALGDCT
jgi:hypothetical protein